MAYVGGGAHEWLPATPEKFERLESVIPGRSGFIGSQADACHQSLFLHKKLPEEFHRRKRMVSPVLYNFD